MKLGTGSSEDIRNPKKAEFFFGDLPDLPPGHEKGYLQDEGGQAA